MNKLRIKNAKPRLVSDILPSVMKKLLEDEVAEYAKYYSSKPKKETVSH